MQKIKFTSHMLYLFFRTLCWILPFITIYFVFFNLKGMLDWNWGAWALFISPVEIQDISHFSALHRLVILLIQLLPLSITILICYKLAKLFQLYEQGYLFEKENFKLIKYVSICMVVKELILVICQPLITAALTFNNPAGERFIRITLGTANVSTLVTAFIILVASWIIKEAHRLKSDDQFTI